MRDAAKEESKEFVEGIIKNHYEKHGINILDLSLELNVYEGARCEACNCLGWDRLSIKISENELDLISDSEGWEPKG